MEITLGGIAALIAALAFVALVIALIRPVAKLSGVVDQLAATVTEITEHTLPAIDEAAKIVRDANGQLARIDTITAAASRTAEDVSALTTLVSSTLAAPILGARKVTNKVKSAFGK